MLLITGATGYLAANLFNSLVDTKFLQNFTQVYLLDRNLKLERLKRIPANAVNQQTDLASKNFSDKDLDLFKKATHIIHAAYLSNLSAEIYFIENLAKLNPNLDFTFFSSAAVYGELGDLEKIFSIEDRCQPVNLYGNYKLYLENLISFYFKKHLLLRIANPYGGDFSSKGVYKIFWDKILSEEGSSVQLNINAQAANQVIRDFIDIHSCTQTIKKNLEKKKHGVINVSSGKGLSLEEFAEQINPSSEKKLIFNYTGKLDPIKVSILKP